MPNFTILLEPAEGKQPGGNPFAPDMFDYRTSSTFNFFDELNPQRRMLIDRLQGPAASADDETLEDLLGLAGAELEEARQVNAEIYDAPLMSALDRYSPGIMYAAMDFAGLPTGAQRRLLENGVIFSGLFGLLRPDDLIPNYRLRMDAELPEIGEIYAYWKPHISPLLNGALAGEFVWDLLPEGHRRAWDDEHAYKERVMVQFVDEEDGERTPAPEDLIKPLHGQLVNLIARESMEDLDDLQEENWEHPEGYRYDEEATTYDEDTKTRTLVLVKGGERERVDESEEE